LIHGFRNRFKWLLASSTFIELLNSYLAHFYDFVAALLGASGDSTAPPTQRSARLRDDGNVFRKADDFIAVYRLDEHAVPFLTNM